MPYRSTPETRARKLARRGTVLAAAAQLFADRGYAAVKVSEVVARARIAVGTFYFYFSDKDALHEAVCEQAAEAWLQALSPAQGLPVEQVAGLITDVVRGAARLGASARALLDATVAVPEPSRQARQRWVESCRQRLHRAIADGAADGSLAQGPIEPSVIALLGAVMETARVASTMNEQDAARAGAALALLARRALAEPAQGPSQRPLFRGYPG